MPQQQFNLPPEIQQLFQATDLGSRQAPTVGKGGIITFAYVGQTYHRIHDPYPLVLVTDIFREMIRGVNCHYLTLPYVKSIIKQHANNPNFSYAFIMHDPYMVSSFRSYKRNGISQLKMLDSKFLQNLLKVVRALNPGEIEAMRAQIKNLISQPIQEPAVPTPEEQGEPPSPE
jgi:hypothetical protein